MFFFISIKVEKIEHLIRKLARYLKKFFLFVTTDDGSVAGKADENNERGMDVDVVADLIVQAVIKQHNEVNIAPIHHKIAMFIRLVSPDLYFWIIKKRSEVNKNK